MAAVGDSMVGGAPLMAVVPAAGEAAGEGEVVRMMGWIRAMAGEGELMYLSSILEEMQDCSYQW